ATGWPGQLNPLAAARILDTRTSYGGLGRLGSWQAVDLPVLGRGGVPGSGVSAVVLSLTATNPAAGGYLTAWAPGACRPFVPNLNFAAGQTIPNLGVVP